MKLLKLFMDWLYSVTGYVPKGIQNKVNIELEKISTVLKHTKEALENSNKQLDAARETIESLEYHVMQSKVLDLEALQKENERIMEEDRKVRVDMEEANEYYKTVQTQLSDIMHKDQMFGFGRSITFPGASAISAGHNQDGFVTIAGRTVLEDSIAAKMDQTSSLSEKYYIAHNQLIKYGLLEKMIDQAISHGGIQYTLAYNDNCTAVELYYAMEVKVNDNIFEIKKKNNEEG